MTAPVTNFETTPADTARRIGRKTAPMAATTTVLVLARLWNASGAEHSTGAAFLMGALAVGTAAAGVVVTNGHHGDPTSSALAFTGAGAFALAGVCAYTDELPLPLLLWAVATVLAYILGFRVWREDRRADEAHARGMEELREKHVHREAVASIEARAAVDSRYVELQIAQENTQAVSAYVDAITARAALPGFDPDALARNSRAHLSAVPTQKAIGD
jgi:hypothetical protein